MNIKAFFTLGSLLISQWSWAQNHYITATEKTQYKANHFYIIIKDSKNKLSAPSSLSPINPQEQDCRENIEKVICLVDPVSPGKGSEERTCLKGSLQYAHFFEELYDNYPPALQKVFCSLKKISIEKQLFGTAYAGTLLDKKGDLKGAIMGIRQSVIDQKLHLTQWSSWKEQLSFGGKKVDYQVRDDLPQVHTANLKNVNDFLYFVVAHEFGHIFDFSNKLNEFIHCGETPLDKCQRPKPESWTDLSWISNKKVKAQDDFHKREELCFYACKETSIPKTDISQLYKELRQRPFISTYAATNPWDDFAEGLAYVTMEKFLGATYEISFEGKTFDIIAKLKSKIFSKKYAYITQFLSRKDIRYP
jgi:hypothetical protein